MVTLDSSTNIEMLPLIQAPLQMLSHIHCQFPEQNSKEATQQGSCQIQTLLSKVITIILFCSSQFTA
jgi:hypothetical protein